MGPRSEFCHRSEILLFLWCQSVEAYTKETLIQCGDRFDGGRLNILKRDWTCFCDVPGMLSPLLKEVGVASGRRVPQQELDLLQIAAVLAAELGASPSQIVGTEPLSCRICG